VQLSTCYITPDVMVVGIYEVSPFHGLVYIIHCEALKTYQNLSIVT